MRALVVRQIWPLIVAVFANDFVTLLLFPGLISEVQYCTIGDWMPVVLITLFNTMDLVAKVRSRAAMVYDVLTS